MEISYSFAHSVIIKQDYMKLFRSTLKECMEIKPTVVHTVPIRLHRELLSTDI